MTLGVAFDPIHAPNAQKPTWLLVTSWLVGWFGWVGSLDPLLQDMNWAPCVCVTFPVCVSPFIKVTWHQIKHELGPRLPGFLDSLAPLALSPGSLTPPVPLPLAILLFASNDFLCRPSPSLRILDFFSLFHLPFLPWNRQSHLSTTSPVVNNPSRLQNITNSIQIATSLDQPCRLSSTITTITRYLPANSATRYYYCCCCHRYRRHHHRFLRLNHICLSAAGIPSFADSNTRGPRSRIFPLVGLALEAFHASNYSLWILSKPVFFWNPFLVLIILHHLHI